MAVEVREFLLPDLGEGLEDAEVVTWRVAEGDVVELNQILVEVNTAKALVEIPAPWAGVIERLHASDGDVVKVGSPLVTIRVEGPASTPEFEFKSLTPWASFATLPPDPRSRRRCAIPTRRSPRKRFSRSVFPPTLRLGRWLNRSFVRTRIERLNRAPSKRCR